MANFYPKSGHDVYPELALGIELTDLVRDVRQLLARSLLAHHPSMS
jgi:hypothetical protein